MGDNVDLFKVSCLFALKFHRISEVAHLISSHHVTLKYTRPLYTNNFYILENTACTRPESSNPGNLVVLIVPSRE